MIILCQKVKNLDIRPLKNYHGRGEQVIVGFITFVVPLFGVNRLPDWLLLKNKTKLKDFISNKPLVAQMCLVNYTVVLR